MQIVCEVKRPDFPLIELRLNKMEQNVIAGVEWYKQQQSNTMYKKTTENFIEWHNRLKNIVALMETLDIFDEEYKQPSIVSPSATNNIADIESDDLSSTDVFVEEFTSYKADYNSRYIVANFRRRLAALEDSVSYMSKISSVGFYLNAWFKVRFSSDDSNKNFHYRAENIHEWIDLIIVAFGQKIHNNLLVPFCTEFDEWLDTIESDHEKKWMLPQYIAQLRNTGTSCYTKEAILIERIIKPKLYDADFYPDLINSLEKKIEERDGIYFLKQSDKELAEDCLYLNLPAGWEDNNG